MSPLCKLEKLTDPSGWAGSVNMLYKEDDIPAYIPDKKYSEREIYPTKEMEDNEILMRVSEVIIVYNPSNYPVLYFHLPFVNNDIFRMKNSTTHSTEILLWSTYFLGKQLQLVIDLLKMEYGNFSGISNKLE